MRTIRVLVLVALAMTGGAGTSEAALTGYTDAAAFQAAIAGLTSPETVDFEGVASGTPFASGAGTGGLSFTYAIPGQSLQVSSTFGTTSPQNYLGLDNPDTAFYLGDSFTIEFDRTIHAVGLYLIAGNDVFAGDFELAVTGGEVSNSAAPSALVSDGQAFYLGLVESDPLLGFTSATVRGVLSDGAFVAFTADDITSAVALVPEPGSGALLLAGLGVLSALGRFHRSRFRRVLMSRFLSRTAFVAVAAVSLLCLPHAASAQEAYLGEIRCFGFNFVPKGWAPLDGALLSISQNTALFSLLGTQFGGDGRTTFALPDMRGRSLIHVGQGPGLTLNAVVGQSGGAETTTLSTAQLPAHSHTVTPQGSPSDATLISPSNGAPATKGRTTLYAPGPGVVPMAPLLSGPVGGGAPVPNRSPYLAVTCGIAVQGIFPSRN